MTELMSPCASFETLNAAIKAGCNSVYFGVKELNMRTGRAKNFELKDLGRIRKICDEANSNIKSISNRTNEKIKCYLTLNSIVYDEELNTIDKILKQVKKHKIDAIIASDWAVIQKANKLKINVHISTQQSCSNIKALKFFSKHCERLVLARELSLEQIKHIKQIISKEKINGNSGKLMQIECFCHGAMCISVSGRCFLSQITYGSEFSANRGKCLQNCRRGYLVKDYEEKNEFTLKPNYVLSPKDLCTLEILDKLVGIIDVLKIEGRGRSVDYVYKVTKAYREALNAIDSGKYDKKKKKILMKNVNEVYNRGFSNGFYLGKPMNEWSNAYGSKATKKKMLLGKVINYFNNAKVVEINIESGECKLEKGNKIAFSGKTTGYYECIAQEIRDSKTNKQINSAKKGDKATVIVSEKLRKGDKVFVIENILN